MALWQECSNVDQEKCQSKSFHCLLQGCTTHISWRAKIFFGLFQGPKFLYFLPFKCCFFQANKVNTRNFGLCGKIESLRGPHLARGPYLVHPWSIINKISNFYLTINSKHMYLSETKQKQKIADKSIHNTIQYSKDSLSMLLRNYNNKIDPIDPTDKNLLSYHISRQY